MASYTDIHPKLTEYSPYRAQLPVEAMVNVGVQKQHQYDEGVQKIQSQIDNIAGMDVVRDVDKQYLQSKLNELGSKLKTVAGGDFSNFQLVNSVGGMASQIVKDPNVVNAVVSTSRYRKGVEDMEAAKKEGKSSPSNEWDFAQQTNQWLSSKDIKHTFNGGFNPYTNYKKNALDVIKSLTKDESITDSAFTTDSKGNLVISDSTVRKKLAGISPEKIQQALSATLAPADFKQMEIDGRYNYSNVSPERFTADIHNSYNDKLAFYNKQKAVLENAKSSTTSNVEKNKLNEQIESLNKTVSGITSQHNSILDMIQHGGIEAAKAQLHTANFIDNFSKAFSFTETSQTYSGKTPQEMAIWRADKEQDWKKFMISRQDDLTKFNLTYAQKERELRLKNKEVEGYGGLPQGVPQDALPNITLDKVVVDTENAYQGVKNQDANFIEQQGESPEWLAQQKDAWDRNPGAVDPVVAAHFDSTEAQRRRADANMTMITDIRKQALEKFGDIKKLIPKNAASVQYTTPAGENYTYTPEDFINFNSKFEKFGVGDASIIPAAKEQEIRNQLTPKEETLYNIYIKKNRGYVTPAEQVLLQGGEHFNELVNKPYSKTVDEINKFTADEVKKRVSISQGVQYGIPTANEAQKSTIGTALSQFATLAESQKGGLANSPSFDPEVAKKLSIDPTANYSMTVVEGTEYQPKMYKINVVGKAGETEFQVTPEQKRAMFGEQFEASPAVQAFRPYQEQIAKMGGYTTALGKGKSSNENAFLSKIDFPSVQTYGVKGNIVQPQPGKYSIRISAYDPISQKWYNDLSYPRQQLITEEQVVPLMQRLSDAAVFELLHEQPATAKDLQVVKNASKKPL